MDDTIVTLLFIGLVAWSVTQSVFTALLWKRLEATEGRLRELVNHCITQVDELEQKIPESRLQAFQQTIDAFRTRIDASVIENEAYREQVHKSMQRFNAIMRRNERALPSRQGSTDQDNDGTPDEIPLGDVRPLDHHRPRPSRAELRELARQKEQQK